MSTILYVDDEKHLLNVGKMFLEASEGFRVDTASSAKEALTMEKLLYYDAIVSDYQMPGMDGIAFLKQIRNSGSQIPFILFTGKGREEVVIQALNEGADFYLQKGGDPTSLYTELSHKIRMAVDRRKAFDQVVAKNRLYSVLSATNKALVNIRNRPDFFTEICRILVKIGGFRMAWIGTADESGKRIIPAASSGITNGYLDMIEISPEDNPRGRGPTGTAYRERKPVIVNDLLTDPGMALWREDAEKRGFRASAAFPFAIGTSDAGVINIYAPLPGLFDDEIIGLLEEMADDITFALSTRREEERRMAAEKARDERQALFKAAFSINPDPVVISDLRTGAIVEANPAFSSWSGYGHHELYGKTIRDLNLWPDVSERDGIVAESEKNPDAPDREVVLRIRSGELRECLFTARHILTEGAGYLLTRSHDVTGQRAMEKRIAQSEAHLASAQQMAHLGSWTYDVATGRIMWTSEAFQIFGRERERGEPDFSEIAGLFHRDDRTDFLQAITAVLKDGTSYERTWRIITPQNETRYIRAQGEVILTNGRITGMWGTILDITGQIKAEEEIRTSRELLMAVIDNTDCLIYAKDLAGRFIIASEPLARFFGRPRDELLGKTSYDFLPGEIAEQHHANDIAVIRQKTSVRIEETTGAGEDLRTFLTTKFPLLDAGGEMYAVCGVSIDITDQKRAELALSRRNEDLSAVNEELAVQDEELRQNYEAMARSERLLAESEERLRLAMEGADIVSWDWNLTANRVVFDRRFFAMLGYEPEGIPKGSDGWPDLIHPDDRARVLPEFTRQAREKRPLCEMECRFRSCDGAWIWVLSRGRVVESDSSGAAIRVTGVSIDISSRKLMESEIQSLNAVLEDRVRQRTNEIMRVNEALEAEISHRMEAELQLRASYDQKVVLLKEIHHRVKNNLQIIASLLNIQARTIKDESTLAAIRESQNRVRAMALVHEKLYRSDDISHISLHDYLKFLGTELFSFYDARKKGIRYRLNIRDVAVDINAAIPLGLIVNELISNSLKYAFPEGTGGEIEIAMQKVDDALTVVYRDTGIGIPETLDWRNAPSLGLRLVVTLVDQMNGTIELDRSSGTRFTLVVHLKD